MNIIKRIFGQKDVDENPAELVYKRQVDSLRREVSFLRKQIKELEERNLSLAKKSVDTNSQKKDNKEVKYEVLLDLPKEDIHQEEGNKEEFVEKKKDVKEESMDLEAKIEDLKKEYASTQALYVKIGDELAELRKQTDRMKISLSTCQKQYKDVYQISEEPKESTTIVAEDEDTDITETTPPPVIIPKLLKIKGYEDFVDVISRNFDSINFHRERDKDNGIFYAVLNNNTFETRNNIAQLANLLKDCGKEILIVKCDPIDKEELEENEIVINTCKKICELRDSGDNFGLEKLLSYFLRKNPLPKNPFSDKKPIDFIQDEYDTIYKSAFFLLYFLNTYHDTFKIDTFKWSKQTWVAKLDKVEINEGLVSLMKILNQLLFYGYKLCIVPILDENILYRPQSAAQDGDVYSLLYYDKYVEIPEMITNEKKEPSLYSAYSSSSGSTYVSGHYRSGYMRNGRWVSGGYVKGHYRS